MTTASTSDQYQLPPPAQYIAPTPAPLLDPPVTHQPIKCAVLQRYEGQVVSGIKQGGYKQLTGYPTANLDSRYFLIADDPSIAAGLYVGWVQINRSPSNRSAVLPALLSINKTAHTQWQWSFGVHIVGWKGDSDFVGAEMRLVVAATLRPQYVMQSKDEQVAWAKADVAAAGQTVQQEQYAKYKADVWFDMTQSGSLRYTEVASNAHSGGQCCIML